MKSFFAVVGFSMIFASVCAQFIGSGLCFAAAAVILACLLILFIKEKRQLVVKYAILSASLMAVALTFVYSGIFLHKNQIAAAELEGQTVVVEGRLLDYPEKAYGKYYYKLEVAAIQSEDGSMVKKNFSTRLSSSYPIPASPYDSLKLEAGFYRYQGDYGFSSEKRYWSQGILLGSYMGYGKYEVRQADDRPISFFFKQFRHSLEQRLAVLLPREEAAISSAMLLGSKNLISDEIDEAFRSAGVTHILVVSGMHMSLISGFILLLLRSFSVRIRNLTAIFAVLFFMGLTGLQPSVMRSGIMIIIWLISGMLGREADSLNSLGFSITVMCISNPIIGADVGFLLSVMATLGIIKLYPLMFSKLKEGFKGKEKLWRFVNPAFSAICLSLAAVAGVFPIQLYVFEQISLASLLATPLMTIPSTLLMYTTPIALLLAEIYLPLASVFQFSTAFMARLMKAISELFSGFVSIDLSGAPGLMALILIILLFAVLLLLGSGKTGKIIVCSASAMIVLLSVLTNSLRYGNVVSVAIVDQGDASSVVLIKGKAAAVLSSEGYNSRAEYEILKKHGIKNLELLIVSSESREAIEAAKLLINQYSPRQILLENEMYVDSQLKNHLESTEHRELGDGGQITVLDNITLDYTGSGSVFFSIGGSKIAMLKGDDEPTETDLLISTGMDNPYNSSFTVLQTDDIMPLELKTSGNYIFARENRVTYIDFDKKGKISYRRDM